MVLAKETGADSGGEDKIIVFEAVTGGKLYSLVVSMDLFCLVEPNVDVLVGFENTSNRTSDVRGRKSRCRDLVEQWLKEVVVSLVHQRDANI
jgi:hypothetical protein